MKATKDSYWLFSLLNKLFNMGNSTHSFREGRQGRPRTVPRDPSIMSNQKAGDPWVRAQPVAKVILSVRRTIDSRWIRIPALRLCAVHGDMLCGILRLMMLRVALPEEE